MTKIPDVAMSDIRLADIEGTPNAECYTVKHARDALGITEDQMRGTVRALCSKGLLSPWKGEGYHTYLSGDDFRLLCKFRRLFEQYRSFAMALEMLEGDTK